MYEYNNYFCYTDNIINNIKEDQLAKKVMLYELDKASNTVKPYCLTSNQFIDTQTDLLLFADKDTALKYNEHLKENKE
jgi:hypothetical protein